RRTPKTTSDRRALLQLMGPPGRAAPSHVPAHLLDDLLLELVGSLAQRDVIDVGVDETPDADVEALEVGDPPLPGCLDRLSLVDRRPRVDLLEQLLAARDVGLGQTTLHPFFGRMEEAQRGYELLACLGDHVGGGEAAGVVDAVDFLAARVDD